MITCGQPFRAAGVCVVCVCVRVGRVGRVGVCAATCSVICSVAGTLWLLSACHCVGIVHTYLCCPLGNMSRRLRAATRIHPIDVRLSVQDRESAGRSPPHGLPFLDHCPSLSFFFSFLCRSERERSAGGHFAYRRSQVAVCCLAGRGFVSGHLTHHHLRPRPGGGLSHAICLSTSSLLLL